MKTYRITYTIGDGIYSALLIEADTVIEAEAKFRACKEHNEVVAGAREVTESEKAELKRRGMSIIK